MEKRRVAVRTMVETVMLSGSISPVASARRLLDGIRGHQALQAIPAEGAQNEVSVSGTVCSKNIELTVYGRIDRLYGDERVEEIKTTYASSEQLSGGDIQHWAQAKCYAFLFCRERRLEQIELRLTYLNLPTGEVTSFNKTQSFDELEEFFALLSGRYLQLLETEYVHTRAVRNDISSMPFPYESFREGQHELAAQVYYALREKSALLAQAPTGTGKTMAVLFPALKALGDGHVSRIFYLTARITQQEAAVAAVRLLNAPHLRTVVLSAKDKMCVHEHPICRDGDCPRAEGYYDRLGDALSALNKTDGLFTPDVVSAYAARFLLCPFELSLDLSTSCDLIICDYNYVFDPRVRLQRFFLTSKNTYALLIDESHNLPDRARSMYSAVLSLKDVTETRRSIDKAHRKLPLYKALKKLEREIANCFEEIEPPVAVGASPRSLAAVAEAALDALGQDGMQAERSLRASSRSISCRSAMFWTSMTNAIKRCWKAERPRAGSRCFAPTPPKSSPKRIKNAAARCSFPQRSRRTRFIRISAGLAKKRPSSLCPRRSTRTISPCFSFRSTFAIRRGNQRFRWLPKPQRRS
jgi:DNA excision repair protein ERCC-2